jgi:hypothetical protein
VIQHAPPSFFVHAPELALVVPVPHRWNFPAWVVCQLPFFEMFILLEDKPNRLVCSIRVASVGCTECKLASIQ